MKVICFPDTLQPTEGELKIARAALIGKFAFTANIAAKVSAQCIVFIGNQAAVWRQL
ncbi:MAG: hypothetical protein ACI8ZB_003758 [Desulforhopalus sp.]|jgi:hypothetical protein